MKNLNHSYYYIKKINKLFGAYQLFKIYYFITKCIVEMLLLNHKKTNTHALL
jgi:hypothetical protein